MVATGNSLFRFIYNNKYNSRAQKHNDRHSKFGRGGPPPPKRDGKRQFDRKSGTGRGKEIKKGGGGAHNWGSDSQEAKQGADVEAAAAAEEEEAPVLAEDEAPEEPAPEPEPEDNTMSYEEYLAKKKEEEAQNEALKPKSERQVDAGEFANLKPKAKDGEEDFLVMGGGKAKRNRKKDSDDQEDGPKVELGFRVAGPDSGGRGRGRGRGRGGDRRGGGGRGEGGRGGRGRGEGRGRGRGEGRGRGGGRGGGRGRGGRGVNPLDASAFPALS